MAATRRVDDVRAGLADESVLAEAVERLRVFTKSEAVADQLVGPVRQQIARIGAEIQAFQELASRWMTAEDARERLPDLGRSEEHTSELQSLMRISYAVFGLKKQIHNSYTSYMYSHLTYYT